jgi:hypothetical protein
MATIAWNLYQIGNSNWKYSNWKAIFSSKLEKSKLISYLR